MDSLIFLIGVTAIVALISLIAYVLGWFFTEVLRHPLRFKPFNCRPCLTYWLTVLFNAAWAFIVAPYLVRRGMVAERIVAVYGIAGVGVLAGFINHLYIRIKFRIYD